jgi:polyisoprenoid-binding protein YceI
MTSGIRSPMQRVVSLIVAWLICSPLQANDQYYFDKGHTRIFFEVNHLGYSTMVGMFRSFDGSLAWDQNDPESARLQMTIDAASVDMFNEELNEHLRNSDFFDVGKHPKIHFRSNRVERLGESGSLTVHGEITLLGVTRPVSFTVVPNKEGLSPVVPVYAAGFSAEGSLARSQFGMQAYVPMVGDEIRFRFEVEAVRIDPEEG